jgi:hypothetical protein
MFVAKVPRIVLKTPRHNVRCLDLVLKESFALNCDR